jgi:hypothetical protein
VHEADGAVNRIDEVNRAAIGDVNPEAKAWLIANQTIRVLETFVSAHRRADDGDIFAMDLLRRYEREISEPMFVADSPMHSVQARERFRFVVGYLDARHAQGETVNSLGQRLQLRELFSRKLTSAHLGDVVVRVVRVVVVWTGCRLPA